MGEQIKTFEELTRCRVCGAHLIGDFEPINITRIGRPDEYVAGSHHICQGPYFAVVDHVEPLATGESYEGEIEVIGIDGSRDAH